MSDLIRLLDHILDLIAPPACAVCDTFLTTAERSVCGLCDQNFGLTHPLPAPDGTPRLAAAYYEGGVAAAILRAKASAECWRMRSLGQKAAEEAGVWLTSFDLVVPVPSSRRRLRQRGWNPVLPVAQAAATVAGVPVWHGLRRPVDEGSQKGRGRNERVIAAGTFLARPLDADNVLLVDDVTTTGATIAACARALRSAGALDVSAFAIAYTERRCTKGDT